ncbi:MAG: hypothetical protein J0L93_02900 [Deltaproteobacteria bacterium]|nr:hypothetical protein [Deltaproteobacteria bacterium]
MRSTYAYNITQCRQIMSKLGLTYSPDGFMERKDESDERKILRSTFPSNKKTDRKTRIDSVNNGALEFFLNREEVGMPGMPKLWKPNVKGRSHAMWEIGIQGYVVSAAHFKTREIAIVTKAMAYLLHDIDDIADRHIASYLLNLDWRRLSNMSPVEFFRESPDGFSTGYAELYEKIMTEAAEIIPNFDRAGFDQATMRMIRGGILYSPKVPLAVREQYLELNKQEHLNKLPMPPEKIYEIGDKPEIELDMWTFLRDAISNVYYGYTVKSLPDGICAFLGKDFDSSLMIFLGIFTAPGLLLENIKKETADGEFSQEGKISFQEVTSTIEKTRDFFTNLVVSGKFDGKINQLQQMKLILDAYGDAFKPILQKAKLWDEHYKVMHELNMRIAENRGN